MKRCWRESRTSVENSVGVGGVVLRGRHLSTDHINDASEAVRLSGSDDTGHLCHAWHLPVVSHPQPGSESHFNRLHSMVESGSRCCYGGAVAPTGKRTRRTATPRCGWSHLPHPHRSDSNTAVGATGISLCLTGTAGPRHSFQTACCARTRPRQCDHINHANPTTSATTTTKWKRWKISLNRGSLSQWSPSRIPT